MSIKAVPPKTPQDQTHNAIIMAIRKDNLYGVIDVGEAWTYFPKRHKGQTAFLRLDGERRVSDLRDGDRTEALNLRMESRRGLHGFPQSNRAGRQQGRIGGTPDDFRRGAAMVCHSTRSLMNTGLTGRIWCPTVGNAPLPANKATCLILVISISL